LRCEQRKKINSLLKPHCKKLLILVGLLTTATFHKYNRFTPTNKEEQRRRDKEKRDSLALSSKHTLNLALPAKKFICLLKPQ
jgi:hypothetical protein